MRKIVAFAGSKGSGKTTAFEEVLNNFPGVTELTFAGKLKNVCSEIFNLDQSKLHLQDYKEKYLDEPVNLEKEQLTKIIEAFGYTADYDTHVRSHVGMILETPRQLLQYIGTDVLHKVDPEIHIKSVLKQLPNDGLVVITDLRFKQEFDYFNDNFKGEFVPFYINNNKAEVAAEGDTHKSEKDLQTFKHKCVLINNNLSLEDYKKLIVKSVKDVL